MSFLYVMAKKTYTYATDHKIQERASNKAKREKTTLSEKIDLMLREYVKPVKKKKTVLVFGAEEYEMKTIREKANDFVNKM